MTRRRNLRLSLATLFFSLCLVVSFAMAPAPAQAWGNCWLCDAPDLCVTSRFGFEECDAVFLESCSLSGNFCSG